MEGIPRDVGSAALLAKAILQPMSSSYKQGPDTPLQDRAAHWEHVYQTKDEAEVSWHQDDPTLSRELITEFAPPGGSVIDVGGGASLLACQLAVAGFAVTSMDISATAIERAKQRGGEVASQVQWIVGDVTASPSLGSFDLWHDRAVFHFLTSDVDRHAYCRFLQRSVRQGGHLVVGTFGIDGPTKCSGLPVQRYNAAQLETVFGQSFSLVRSFDRMHATPWGSMQSFQFAVMQRA